MSVTPNLKHVTPGSSPHLTVVTPPPRKARRWPFLLAVIALAAWLGPRYVKERATAAAVAVNSQVRTAKVDTGSVQKVLRLTGSTRARNFRSIAAPRMRGADSGRNLVLIYVAPSGSIVKKGDLVAQIDAQALHDHVDDIKAQIVRRKQISSFVGPNNRSN